MNIMWFSCGVSSFIAAWLVRYELQDIRYQHISDQHPDSLRFLHDCENVLDRKITIETSQYYTSVEDVCLKKRCVNTPQGAPCRICLKQHLRQKWEYYYIGSHTYFWGLDCEEQKRAERFSEWMPDHEHRFPLIERQLTKQDCHAMLDRMGIKRPAMYDMGYHNNNCIGCVKGGKGYWNKIRIDFPDVFAARAKMEREIGHSCINGTFLDELDPSAGRNDPPITQECGMYCMIEEAKGTI